MHLEVSKIKIKLTRGCLKMKYDIVNLSKFLSLILRHSPEKINIKLDENGWVKDVK